MAVRLIDWRGSVVNMVLKMVLDIGRVEVGGAGAVDVRVCDWLAALEHQGVGAFGGGREAVSAIDRDDGAGHVLVVSAVGAQTQTQTQTQIY